MNNRPQRLSLAPLRSGHAFPIDDATVTNCLQPDRGEDQDFYRSWTAVRSGQPQRIPAHIAPVTGHVAESVASVILSELGFHLFWHLTGPGHHGVDLLMLDPAASTAVAWEVKGTLRARGFPRLSVRDVAQMSSSWLDSDDGTGMSEWDLDSSDVLGGFVVVSFARMTMWVGVTADYERISAIGAPEALQDLSWVWHDLR